MGEISQTMLAMPAPEAGSLDTASLAAAIPDARGANFYDEDPVFAPLLSLYAGSQVRDMLHPHLQELGQLAGTHLDELAVRLAWQLGGSSQTVRLEETTMKPFSKCFTALRLANQLPSRHIGN